MKNNSKLLIVTVLILVPLIISGCCNCGKSIAEGSGVSGTIFITGNDPFTKLALQTDDEKVYLLECSEEMKKELWSKQGGYYLINFTELKTVDGKDVLAVEKVMPIKKEN